MSDTLKCANDGEIVPIADIDCSATHPMTQPDSDFGPETWEAYCVKSAQKHAHLAVIDDVRRTSRGVAQ